MSALTFANLLHEIFGVEVPVGVIVSPASDLQALADYIEAERRPGAKRPTFASVHGRGATEVHASDLTLDKFIDAAHPRRGRVTAGAEHRGPHRPADRRHRLPRPLPRPGMAASGWISSAAR